MRMESSDSSFGRCNTPSLATYSAAALAKAERKMNHWEQQALGQLHDAVSSQNLLICSLSDGHMCPPMSGPITG